MSRRVKVGGHRPSVASWTLMALCAAVGLLHLFAPLLWPMSMPSAESIDRQAPYVGAMTIVLVSLLAIAIWVDSNREAWPLGLATMAVISNVLIRELFNIGLGVELNFVVPIVVGMAAGGPMGFLVGAASCLISQFGQDQISPPLAGQMLVWGLAGALGGMLRPLGPRLSCAVAPFAGVLFGLVAGLLLNAFYWPADTSAIPAFIPVAPFQANLGSLVQYGRDTSFGVDLLRGLVTGTGLALVAWPASSALRTVLRPPATADLPVDPGRGDLQLLEAVARRDRSRTTTQMWS